MDLAWVLLIWIRSLFLFLCSPVLRFIFTILYSFFATHFALFLSFFLCVSYILFFSRGNEDVAILEGGTCDRVTLP